MHFLKTFIRINQIKPPRITCFNVTVCRRLGSTSSAKVKVPANLYSLEGRYATALYTAAAKSGGSGAFDAISRDLSALSAYISKNAHFGKYLADPTLSRTDKKNMMQHIALKLGLSGGKQSGLVLGLLNVLAENGRLGDMAKVISAYEEMMKAHRKEVAVTIITAKEAEPSYLKRLSDMIVKQFIPDGQVPTFKCKTDPSILGGLIVRIADRTIDLSVVAKVNKINQQLAQSI